MVLDLLQHFQHSNDLLGNHRMWYRLLHLHKVHMFREGIGMGKMFEQLVG
jgi:hypothetical protein